MSALTLLWRLLWPPPEPEPPRIKHRFPTYLPSCTPHPLGHQVLWVETDTAEQAWSRLTEAA